MGLTDDRWTVRVGRGERLNKQDGTEVDDVFRALADPSRRRLLDSLNARGGQTLRELCAGLDMARQSVSKHLAVLEGADVVITVRRGREKLHYLNAAPINDIADRWISEYHQRRVHALADLKATLEDTTMQKAEFVYTTYIHTTPEQLWQALVDPAFTVRYWNTTLVSDWRVGSPITWERNGVTVADPAQVVLVSDPPRRLAYTWITHTSEFVASAGLGDEFVDKAATERRSKVTFLIEPIDGMVRLTVVHDDFEPGSVVLPTVSRGWPRVLSDLKTMLEAAEMSPA